MSNIVSCCLGLFCRERFLLSACPLAPFVDPTPSYSSLSSSSPSSFRLVYARARRTQSLVYVPDTVFLLALAVFTYVLLLRPVFAFVSGKFVPVAEINQIEQHICGAARDMNTIKYTTTHMLQQLFDLVQLRYECCTSTCEYDQNAHKHAWILDACRTEWSSTRTSAEIFPLGFLVWFPTQQRVKPGK